MSEWKSCKTSEPESSGLVKVFGYYGNKRTTSMIGKFDSVTGKFTTDTTSFTVTHWQPLTTSSNRDILTSYQSDETWTMSKEHILQTAYKMAQRDGFASLTRDGVAAEAGVAMGSVNHHYGQMIELRKAVMQLAVDEKQLELIAQGLALGDDIARSAPADVKAEALNTLL